ncbi:MAG: zinc ribbon domain-containing protein, partial [Deltaproteobacteria bacterium]|nr:zinc ribbon domain-containing protein [Deltaproteobacteria bacterium]
RMPAPDWDEHQADESIATPIEARVEDDDPIAPPPPPVDEPQPVDRMVSERRQAFVPDDADSAVERRPAKPSKIPHTNPHASPPPPLLGAPCAQCGSINPPHAKFCARCGLTVGEHVSQPMGSAPSTAPLIMPVQLGGPPLAKTMMADASLSAGPISQPQPAGAMPPPGMPGLAQPSGFAPIASAKSGPVSPYAATMQQQAYQPVPGDPLYSDDAPSPKVSQPKYPPMPESGRRSILPIVLVAVGVAVLLAVILLWFLG